MEHRTSTATADIRTDDPDLRLLLDDGRILRTCGRRADRRSFQIPSGAHAVRLLSRSARPSDSIGPFVDDRRQLGVAVTRLVFWQELESTAIAPATIDLPGWHAMEADLRWTDGAADLDLPAAGAMATLDIHLAATLTYTTDDAPKLVSVAA